MSHLSTEQQQDALLSEFPPVPTEAWLEKIRADLGEDFEEKLTWDALDGAALRAFYRRDDLPEGAPLRATSAVQNGRPRIRQDVTLADPEARRRLREALEGGVTDLGLSAAGAGELRQEDIRSLLEGISLDDTPLHLTGGPVALPLLAMLLNEADRRKLDAEVLRGSLTHDPLGAWARGEETDLDGALARTARLLRNAPLPRFRPLTVDAQIFHDASGSAVQELAATLAAASEYLAQLTERGVEAEAMCRRMQFVVPVGTNFFVEIAKFRALRLLFTQVIAAYVAEGCAQPATHNPQPTIHAVTSRRQATVYDPHANLLRVTTEAAAAVFGGCDVLAVRPFDALYRTPSTFSLRLARNLPLLLEHEAHLGRVADPAGGSYYVEALTDRLARRAWALFQQIEADGGLIETLRSGTLQRQIAAVRTERSEAASLRERVQVGVNHYPDPGEDKLDEVEQDRLPKSRKFRESPSLPSNTSLDELRQAFSNGAALSDVLASSEAPPNDIDPLPVFRPAAPFEELRLRTERHARETGRRPRVFLLPIGNPSMRSARANFARNVFGCAGFAVEEKASFDTPEEGAHAAVDANADLVVLCSTDEAYPESAPAVRALLDEETFLVIAGPPQDALQGEADGFVHRGMNLLETLRDYQQALGMRDEIQNRKSEIQNRRAS